jgi:hypothetical protein
MTTEPILPGLEDAFTAMQMNAASADAIEKLPVFTAERVAVHDKDRYDLAARLLFSENISRRTICKWLHMSPNTLSAIEVRELRLHPEYVKALQEESKAEIEQLKRLGLEAMRARFFDKKAMSKTGLKDIATCVKLLNEMSSSPVFRPSHMTMIRSDIRRTSGSSDEIIMMDLPCLTRSSISA